MPKKVKKVKQKQRQSQKQIVNINLGKAPKKRGKRKTQITKPVITNYQLPPPPLYNITYQQPSLIPPPVAPVARSSAVAESLIPAPLIEPSEVRGLSLPVRAGLAVGSGIGSAIVSSGSAVLSSIFWPPDVERPAVAPVGPFPVREEPPAFANVEPVFAEPPFPLVPYQAPLPAPEDEFFDLPEDPFNLEQPPEDVFNVAPAAPAAAPAIEEPELLPYDPAQFEELRQQTAQYREAEQPKAQPKKAPLTALQKEEAKAKRKAKKQQTQRLAQLEQSYLLPESEYNPFGVNTIAVLENKPVFIKAPKKEESKRPNLTFFDLPEEQPAFGLEVAEPKKAEKEKGGLERVRSEQTEEPLQYGFSN